MVALRPRHAALPPKAVKYLVRLFSLHAESFIGQIAKRPRGTLMAANTGIAVLTLIEFLLFNAKPLCRCHSVDISGRNQMDNAAAVAADLWNFQTHPPLRRIGRRRLNGFLGFFLSCRRTHGILQVIGVLCTDRQHTALGDAEGDRPTERL